eukprot:966115_1
MRLRTYCAGSLGLAIASIGYAMIHHSTFYQQAVFLSTEKICVAIWGNFLFMLLVVMGQLAKDLFFGTLNNDEVHQVIDNSKWAVIDTCLAVTIFREDLDSVVLFMFVTLMFTKAFHWVATMRVEGIGLVRQFTVGMHIRLAGLLLCLATFDLNSTIMCTSWFNSTSRKSSGVFMLFAFEFAILFVSSLDIAAKYLIILNDQRHGGRWAAKPFWAFYIDLSHDVTVLVLYLVFFVFIFINFGLPIYLFREVFYIYSHLRTRIKKFVNYRKIVVNLDERFPTIRGDEFGDSDRTCIICREDMIAGKKLTCDHVFHFDCLRSWLERQQKCPTCRAEIPVNQPLPRPANRAAAAPANNNNMAAQDNRNMAAIAAQFNVNNGAAAPGPPNNAANAAPNRRRLNFADLFGPRANVPPANIPAAGGPDNIVPAADGGAANNQVPLAVPANAQNLQNLQNFFNNAFPNFQVAPAPGVAPAQPFGAGVGLPPATEQAGQAAGAPPQAMVIPRPLYVLRPNMFQPPNAPNSGEEKSQSTDGTAQPQQVPAGFPWPGPVPGIHMPVPMASVVPTGGGEGGGPPTVPIHFIEMQTMYLQSQIGMVQQHLRALQGALQDHLNLQQQYQDFQKNSQTPEEHKSAEPQPEQRSFNDLPPLGSSTGPPAEPSTMPGPSGGEPLPGPPDEPFTLPPLGNSERESPRASSESPEVAELRRRRLQQFARVSQSSAERRDSCSDSKNEEL